MLIQFRNCLRIEFPSFSWEDSARETFIRRRVYTVTTYGGGTLKPAHILKIFRLLFTNFFLIIRISVRHVFDYFNTFFSELQYFFTTQDDVYNRV